jgi:hypothetical protein
MEVGVDLRGGEAEAGEGRKHRGGRSRRVLQLEGEVSVRRSTLEKDGRCLGHPTFGGSRGGIDTEGGCGQRGIRG